MNDALKETCSVHVLVEGQVQGVGYRFWCERTATALGLDGWVRNRRDGRVEALFHGPSSVAADMAQRCHEGPQWAEVAKVDVHDADEAGFGANERGFHIKPTV